MEIPGIVYPKLENTSDCAIIYERKWLLNMIRVCSTIAINFNLKNFNLASLQYYLSTTRSRYHELDLCRIRKTHTRN